MHREDVGQRSGAEAASGRVKVAPPETVRSLRSEDEVEATAQRIGVEQKGPQTATTRTERQGSSQCRCAHAARTADHADQARLAPTVESRRQCLEDAVLLDRCEHALRAQLHRGRPPAGWIARHQKYVITSRQLQEGEPIGEVFAHDHRLGSTPRATRRRDVSSNLGSDADRCTPAQRIVEEMLVSGSDQGQFSIGHTHTVAPNADRTVRELSACGGPYWHVARVDAPILKW
jgi:hypothetical protein